MNDKKLSTNEVEKKENYNFLSDLVYLKSNELVSNMNVDTFSNSDTNEQPIYVKHGSSDSNSNEQPIYVKHASSDSNSNEQLMYVKHASSDSNSNEQPIYVKHASSDSNSNEQPMYMKHTSSDSNSNEQPMYVKHGSLKSTKKDNSNIKKVQKKAKQVNKKISFLLLFMLTTLTVWTILEHNGIKLSDIIKTNIDEIYADVEDNQNKADLIIDSHLEDSKLDKIENSYDDSVGVHHSIINTESDSNKNNEASNLPTTLSEVEERINPILSGYLGNFAIAINEGNFNMIEPYILDNSELYIQQKSYIPKIFERGIKEEFLGYNITSITYDFENYKGVVAVSETYAIIKTIEGTRNENTYSNRYEFELDFYTNEFLLTKLYLD